MSGNPSFVLSGPGATLIADGIRAGCAEPAAAQAALRSGRVPIMMGALPFDVTQPSSLFEPNGYRFADALPEWPAQPLPAGWTTRPVPAAEEHRARVRRAVQRLRSGGTLHKVVLARSLELSADTPIDARTVLTRLVADDPAANAYFVDLSAAGPGYRGKALLGASPELLVARRGDRVSCQPFAGSAPRAVDPAEDDANGAGLAASAKNRLEHQLVVDAVRKALDPLCVDLQVAPAPQLSRTAALWHLSTPFSGRLREDRTTALDLALALHPTPAVGGVPADAAAAVISELEGDRGFYAGATGWCDGQGDGRWVVSIRCAELSADRRVARAYSGGGIVAESDPDDELAETTTKFKTVLTALGVEQ